MKKAQTKHKIVGILYDKKQNVGIIMSTMWMLSVLSFVCVEYAPSSIGGKHTPLFSVIV